VCDLFVGDPLEVESFSKTGFQVSAAVASSVTVNTVLHQEKGLFVKVLHRYQFSSALKRMSVLAEVAHKAKNTSVMSSQRMVFSKGAPEVLQKHLRKVPANYEATYTLHMSMGRRVIALAYRMLEEDGVSVSYPRAKAEHDLSFLGFLVFDSALKSDSKSVMGDLKWMHIPIVMITGDSPYTAADVAKKLSMISKNKGLLVLDDIDGQAMWKFVANTKKGKVALGEDHNKRDNIAFNPNDIEELSSDNSLCVTGQALRVLESTCHTSPYGVSFAEVSRRLCPHVRIYARVSPSQKESIVLSMNSVGMYTLMCGDGTNVRQTLAFLDFRRLTVFLWTGRWWLEGCACWYFSYQ
jgi:manganese-transporting P-type ATPase